MTSLGPKYKLYIDAGVYPISHSIVINSGISIIGECWPLFVATGSNFTDLTNPSPMIKVGTSGEIGNVQIQQVIFTTAGATGGLVAVEWNIRADAQGSAAMWGSSNSPVCIDEMLKICR